MNFLCNKQVLGILFILKNQFLYLFTYFIYSLDWASIFREGRGLGRKFTETQSTVPMDRGLVNKSSRVSLTKIPGRRGMFRPEPHDPTSTARIRSSLLYTSARFLALGCQINGPDHQMT
jgi:hypothetical protein